MAEKDGSPTSPGITERGEYSVSAYVRAGSWNDAVREAD